MACTECHTRDERPPRESLPGFYMPGRDRNPWVDGLGCGLLVARRSPGSSSTAARAWSSAGGNGKEEQLR